MDSPSEGPLPIRYGKRFLDAYTGQITTDPDVALVELVANAWDAGATTVKLTIPSEVGGRLGVEDDGCGMSRVEFERRWSEFSYNRLSEQGPDVVFPDGTKARSRKAFGRNGKGRHALFCFSAAYRVLTWKEGELNEFNVRREAFSAERPITIEHVASRARKGHGTKLIVESQRQLLDADRVRSIIGSRFIVDPEFRIMVNDEPVERIDLQHLVHEKAEIILSSGERLEVWCIDTLKPGRTTQQTGQVWWVNKRLVEETRWDGVDRKLLDGRTAQAKRYTFIVEADGLVDDVEGDWTTFRRTPRIAEARSLVAQHVEAVLGRLLLGTRKVRKSEIIEQHEAEIRTLAPSSRQLFAQFLEEVLQHCPSISQKDLANTAKVLIKLEQSRSKYSILRELAARDPNDLDSLAQILSKWDVKEAEIVLDELQTRLDLIRDLDRLVRDRGASELHDLQPLFQRGLWIFGAEYESIEFTSNQTLATVLQTLLGGGASDIPRRRPDFVILPDGSSSLSIESRDAYENGEPTGRLAQVVIVELKRGTATVGDAEMDQAVAYARAIRRSGQVQPTTEIIAFVLGGAVNPNLEPDQSLGAHTKIVPLTFDGILRRAQSRTFHLIEKIRRYRPPIDADINAVMAQRAIDDVFGRPIAVTESTQPANETVMGKSANMTR